MKTALRKKIRTIKSALTAEEMATMSQAVIKQLLSTAVVKSARTIMMYYPLSDEPDTREALDILRAEGKTVLLPHVINDTDMEPRPYTGRENLSAGAFGIQEPRTDDSCRDAGYHKGRPYNAIAPSWSPISSIDVVVVPGMAFDGEGNRLGRGKGYYDRMLGKMKNTYKIGLCFPFQLVDHVPTGDNDIRMDLVVS